jgi:hypothetical protein
MEWYRRRSDLNITLLPVRDCIALPNILSDPKSAADAAQQVLAVYDYARAKTLVVDLKIQTGLTGPYLVARRLSEN